MRQMHSPTGASPGVDLAIHESGSIDSQDAYEGEHAVDAVHGLDQGIWVSCIVGAPESENRAFLELFPDGLPAAVLVAVERYVAPASAAAP